jgi:hypothetical protein
VNDLTHRLANGDHPVTIGGTRPSPAELRRRIEEVGQIRIKFTATRGGTDLGMTVDHAASDFMAADFDQGTGAFHVEGTLVLDYVPVRCVADLDLATLAGTGHLVIEE